ncbi:hypothetical protein FB451DRAFT_1058599, partial [Mycena latifolia]
VRLGSFFTSFEKGRDAVFEREARLGHIWRIGQTKRASDGSIRRITVRCNHYGRTQSGHHSDIDPSDYRTGRTNRTQCMAHANFAALPAGGWHVTVVDWTHNHPREVPVGGSIPRPPTLEQRQLVKEYAVSENFARGQISNILASRFPDHILEPRQISNLINDHRKDARDVVQSLGGDFPAILASVRELKLHDPRWDFDLKLDERQVVIALWWQSPTQAELTRRYSDILINDNTYCRNQYGYPLNIGQ